MNVLDLFTASTPWAIEASRFESMVKTLREHGPKAIESKTRDTQAEFAATREAYITGKGLSPLDRAFTAGRHGSVAVIPIVGTIRPRPSFSIWELLFGTVSTNLVSLMHDVDIAMADRSIEHILLNIDSPGGLAAGVGEAAEYLRDAASQKPMTAYTTDLMASAAYWLGAAANDVVAAETASVGSIGVRATVMDWSKYDEALGIKEYVIVNDDSPLKGVDPASDQGRELIKTQVNDHAEIFLNGVADFRGVSRETVNADFGRGDVLIGAKAVEANLADRLSTFDQLLAELNKTAHRGDHRMGRSHPTAEHDAPLTKEAVAADYPAIAQAFRDEGRKEGHAEGLKEGTEAGAKAERERIQAIESEFPEPEVQEVVSSLKFDAEQDAGSIALEINRQRRDGSIKSQAQRVAEDAPDPIEDATGEAETDEEQKSASAKAAAERFNKRNGRA